VLLRTLNDRVANVFNTSLQVRVIFMVGSKLHLTICLLFFNHGQIIISVVSADRLQCAAIAHRGNNLRIDSPTSRSTYFIKRLYRCSS
jgi:hypothetical protein